jgi:hypothetical protein
MTTAIYREFETSPGEYTEVGVTVEFGYTPAFSGTRDDPAYPSSIEIESATREDTGEGVTLTPNEVESIILDHEESLRFEGGAR